MSLKEKLLKALEQGEGETVEFKASFTGGEIFKTLSAFSNTKGGDLWIGIKNDGSILGADVGHESLRDWANRIRHELGITSSIEPVLLDDKNVVLIHVEESFWKPVRYRGRAYVRSGSTNRIATEEEETRWVLERTGLTWDSLPEFRAKWEHIDSDQVKRFRDLCNKKGRRQIPPEEDDRTVLGKLGLVTEDGQLTRAAVLLFGKDPHKFYLNAVVKIGRFRSPTLIIDDREIYGSLMHQVDETMRYFREHLQTQFEFKGEPAREVHWEYPLEALREAVINALIHRDYIDSGHVQIRWYDDHLVIINPGTLMPPLTLEDIKRPHRSFLRNRLLAEMFYYMGWIERWGTGIEKILTEFKKAGLPEPEWRESQGAIWLTFRKDVLTEEYLESLGLNERQIKAIMHIKNVGSISNKEYQQLTGASRATATRDLSELVKLGIIRSVGTGKRVIRYIINESKMSQK